MNLHRLELDPRVYAFDKATDDELHADQVVECGSRVLQFGAAPKTCHLPAGHAGVCEWARKA